MLFSDNSKLTIFGIFLYVKSMSIVVNENVYMDLKVINSAEFLAVDIVKPLECKEF